MITGRLPSCAFVVGDFFVSAAEGAHVYLLKSVLHDWDAARCLAILSSCARAMTPAARLVEIEGVMAPI